MKLQSDPHSGATPYRHAVLLSSAGEILEWPVKSYAELLACNFDQIVALKPELILLGTGNRQHFPKPELLKPLIEAKIGYEIMDSQAACRTYNILVGEGRQVLLALIVDAT